MRTNRALGESINLVSYWQAFALVALINGLTTRQPNRPVVTYD